MAVALTTTDNPYNPITQFEDWYGFDELHGYHTTSYLARIAKLSPDLSPRDYEEALEEAIDEIVKYNLIGKYKKITI